MLSPKNQYLPQFIKNENTMSKDIQNKLIQVNNYSPNFDEKKKKFYFLVLENLKIQIDI